MLYTLLIIAIAAADQLIKWAVVANMSLGQSIPLWGFIHLTYVQNTGAAFSILTSATWFFVFMTIVVLVVLVLLWRKPYVVRYHLSLAIIVGGAIGNLLDRIFRGYVVDFIDFTWFPIFNLADIAVVGGVILFCVQILFFSSDKRKPTTTEGDGAP